MGQQNTQKAINVDGLSVHDGRIGSHLKNLTKSMSVIDASFQSIFPQIGAQLLQHDLDGELYDAVGDGGVGLKAVRHEGGSVLLQQAKELRAAHKGELHDFAHAVDEVAAVLGGDEGLVEPGGQRGVEGTDAVFERPHCRVVPIDAALDADAGVDDGQQGGWNSDVRNAASVTAGGKADNVQETAAANGDDGLPPQQPKLTEVVENGLDGGKAFVELLAVEDDKLELDLMQIKVADDSRRVEGVDGTINDDETTLVAGGHEALGQSRVLWGQNVVVNFDGVLDGELVVVGPCVQFGGVGLLGVCVVDKDVLRGGRERTCVSMSEGFERHTFCCGGHCVLFYGGEGARRTRRGRGSGRVGGGVVKGVKMSGREGVADDEEGWVVRLWCVRCAVVDICSAVTTSPRGGAGGWGAGGARLRLRLTQTRAIYGRMAKCTDGNLCTGAWRSVFM